MKTDRRFLLHVNGVEELGRERRKQGGRPTPPLGHPESSLLALLFGVCQFLWTQTPCLVRLDNRHSVSLVKSMKT